MAGTGREDEIVAANLGVSFGSDKNALKLGCIDEYTKSH
jgi:hypothetical protein